MVRLGNAMVFLAQDSASSDEIRVNIYLRHLP